MIELALVAPAGDRAGCRPHPGVATGVVAANITSSSTGYDSKSWEQLSYYFDVQAWLPKNMVFVSKKAFRRTSTLPPARWCSMPRPLPRRAAGRSLRKNRLVCRSAQEERHEGVLASDALRADLLKVGDRMTAEWLDKAGADGKAVPTPTGLHK